jgi:hypothetical protein
MSKSLFTQVAMKRPTQSTFDLTHDVKMSGKMGKLIPSCCFDVLPADQITIGADAYIKLAPILAPIMHRVDFSIHYFNVPTRIMWENWEKFISNTKDENGDDYVQPYVTIDYLASPNVLRVMDYLGISPPSQSTTESEDILAYPFKAFILIYNEYYRDQNLIQPIEWDLVDGDNTAQFFSIFNNIEFNRAWEHDYFTSCLPFAQKGASVDIPLGNVTLSNDLDASNAPFFIDATQTALVTGTIQQPSAGSGDKIEGTDFPGETAYLDPNGSLIVGATTINDLRRAYRLQEWLEKNARGGTRYTELVYVHFDQKSPDSRLQRPEYITGIKAPIIVSEVLNTTGPTQYWNTETNQAEQTGSPQGLPTGVAAGMHQGRLGRYTAQEHGWIIGIFSCMPKTAYQQGINRMFTRKDFLDYAWPTFANLGEQEVLTREIFAYTNDSNDLFGYIPRYAEYKFLNSRVAGDFRTTLDYWHLGRIFPSAPSLNKSFIECTPEDVIRIFAVQDETDNIWMHVLNKIRAKRKLPFFGTPTI